MNGVDNTKTTSPRNILIQSDIGGGKSTLCHRLAYLWAKNSVEIQRLDSFDLVFLIKVNLIQLDDKSIFDFIKRVFLSDEQADIKDLIQVLIKDHRMLFIVDGYDELSGNRNILEKLLDKSVCPQSTVIVTARNEQIPPLKYFTNGFDITRLSSEDVQTFLSKLPRSTDVTLTKIDLDTHPLGAILSTPLFLWFYYLLGKEAFKGVDVRSRTSLFTRIVNGILLRASNSLKKTKAECREALKILEELAYKCLCDDKIHFDQCLNDLSAGLGLVKQSHSHLELDSHTTYTFTHKSLAEYLTAKYIVQQTDGDVVGLLSKIPEVQDAQRRQTSWVFYFVCGILNSERQFISICKLFLPKATQKDSHEQHMSLQCAAEVNSTELLSHALEKRVCKEVVCKEVVCSSQCNQYCALGAKRLFE